MRILRLIQTLNPAIGGPIESVRQSSASLQQRGHTVEVAVLDRPDAPWLSGLSFPVRALGTGRGGYGYSPQFVPWLKEHANSFDAVLVHGLWQYLGLSTWRVLRNSSTPYYVFPHGMLDPWFAERYPLKHLKKRLYWPIESRVLANAAAVLFTSEEEQSQARKSFFGEGKNAEVVSYGTAAPAADLSAARTQFLEQFPALRDKRLILFLGRLHDKKGCDLLLDGFAAVFSQGLQQQGYHLVMAGPAEPEYLETIKARARSAFSGISEAAKPVTFAGMLTGNAKWRAFAAAEVFVLPSHQENFGIAVAESLACGTPVLVSNKVNIWREIVEDGAGFSDDDTAAGVQRLLRRWAKGSDAERSAMSEKARSCFARRFEIGRATDSLIAVLSKGKRDR